MLICSISSLNDLFPLSNFKKINILELRLDLFSIEDLLKLIHDKIRFQHDLIVTFKNNNQDYDKSIEIILKLRPRYIDIDESLLTSWYQKIKTTAPFSDIIVSKHTTEVDQRYLFFQKYAHIKLKKLVIETEDASIALQLAVQAKQENLILFAAGNITNFSRFFSKWHYCYYHTPTGKGQLSVHDLQEIYNQSSQPQVFYALIGNPVHQSLSHITHNQILKKYKKDAIYLKIQLENVSSLDLDNLKKLGCQGLSITTPFKSDISKLLKLPEKIANTYCFSKQELSNTDVSALQSLLTDYPATSCILILGYGDCGKSFYQWLIHKFKHVDIWQRKSPIELNTFYDVIINTTSTSMPLDLLPHTSLFINLNRDHRQPLESILRTKETKIISGQHFFYLQAMHQFKFWISHFQQINEQEFFYLVKQVDRQLQLN